jgi:hypothetical protein
MMGFLEPFPQQVANRRHTFAHRFRRSSETLAERGR